MSSTTAGDVRLVTSEMEKKWGLPDGTLYKIAGIESSYRKDAVSPKGAKGYFGFMPATAVEYKLSDPTDLHKSADAAGWKMSDLLKKHNGNMDFALVDYNGGGKAVKALVKGSPWGESADYLAKFHGKRQEEIAANVRPTLKMGDAVTSQTNAPLTNGPDASRLALDQQQHDNEYGGAVNGVRNMPRAIGLGFQTQNIVWNYFQERGIEQFDPEYQGIDQKTLDKYPQRHWAYLNQSGSAQELERREARLSSIMAKEEELGRMGTIPSLIGGMAGSLLDVDTLAAFIPGIGTTASLMSKTSRVSNFLRLGSMAAGTNVAMDYASQGVRPTATLDDLYFSAAFGFAFGGTLGGAASPAKLAMRAENNALRDLALKGAKGQIEDDIAVALRQPSIVNRIPPTDWAAKDAEWKAKLNDWAGGLGLNAPERPRMAVLRTGPEEPAAPKGVPSDVPTARPFDPPEAAPATANPSGKPWEAKWDTPSYQTRMGAPDILTLPPMNKISELADYVRTYSKNRDFAMLMDRALKNIDLRKVKFAVIDPGFNPRKAGLSRTVADSISSGKAYGVVGTPHGSRGEGIEMALRGYGYGTHNAGLNEETFVHELLHAATVYKVNLVRANTPGLHKESRMAYRELEKLYSDVKTAAVAMDKSKFPPRFKINMQDPYEFISYGMTNRPFQEWLKSVEIAGPRTTLWTRFTDSVRKLLGMSAKEGNAYARLIDLSDALFERTGVEGRPRAQFEAKAKIVTNEDITAAEKADIAPVFGWGLGMEHRLGSQKVTAPVRDLASKLFGSTVGYKDHGVVKRNAWDDTTMMADAWVAQNQKVGLAAFDKWFKDSGRGRLEKGQAWDEFGEQVSDYIRGFRREFHPEVVRAGNNIRKLMDEAVDDINNPAARNGGKKRGLTEQEKLNEDGTTEIVGTLQKNPHYLPRKHDSTKWDAFVTLWGRDAAEGFWARAYHEAHPERTAEDAQKWAGWYARTVEEAHINRSTDHLEEMMSGFDEAALKESLVRNGGFTESEAWSIIQGMFQKPNSDAGRTSASLRHRNHINETYSEKWKNAEGEEVEITMNDFIRSNAFDVSNSYFRRTASSIALANRLDVYKQSDIGKLIAEATDQRFGGKTMDDTTAARAREDLKFAFERIQGLPQEEWTAWGKGFEMWRDFNVIRLMGGAVWNQVTEMSQIVGSMGWKATLGAVPELRALRRDIQSGKAPSDLLDHLENTIGGVGSEYVARLDFQPKDDWVRQKGDTAGNRRLDQMDTALKRTARGVLEYTGMTGMMIQQKRTHAVALVNHFVNAANGNPSKFLTNDRLAWMGMSPDDYKRLSASIKRFSTGTKQGEYGKKVDFDFKAMAAEEPEMHSMLANAIHRESRRVVQENDLASMVPLMGTTLGKTVFQFMNFTINGWNKSMLFAMNHRDFATLSTMMHGALFASLSYMGRTQLSAAGMDATQREEFLDKRMAGKQIVANSFGKMAQASLLPALYDSTLGNVTGAMFSGMRSTSDLTSMASNPTLQGINSVLSMGKMIRNGVSDEYQTTSRDIQTWGKLLPLNNVVPISTMLNALARDYPYNEEEAN